MRMKKLFGWSFASFGVMVGLAAAVLMATPSQSNASPVHSAVSTAAELPTVMSTSNSALDIVSANSHN